MLECGGCRLQSPAGTLFCLGCGLPLAASAPAAPVATRGVKLVETQQLVPTGRVLKLPDTAWEGTLELGRLDLAGGVVVDLDLEALGGRALGVSRRHARLRYAAGRLEVEDAGSAHGTWLNKQRLGPGEPALLADGDELRLAGMCFRVEVR